MMIDSPIAAPLPPPVQSAMRKGRLRYKMNSSGVTTNQRHLTAYAFMYLARYVHGQRIVAS